MQSQRRASFPLDLDDLDRTAGSSTPPSPSTPGPRPAAVTRNPQPARLTSHHPPLPALSCPVPQPPPSRPMMLPPSCLSPWLKPHSIVAHQILDTAALLAPPPRSSPSRPHYSICAAKSLLCRERLRRFRSFSSTPECTRAIDRILHPAPPHHMARSPPPMNLLLCIRTPCLYNAHILPYFVLCLHRQGRYVTTAGQKKQHDGDPSNYQHIHPPLAHGLCFFFRPIITRLLFPSSRGLGSWSMFSPSPSFPFHAVCRARPRPPVSDLHTIKSSALPSCTKSAAATSHAPSSLALGIPRLSQVSSRDRESYIRPAGYHTGLARNLRPEFQPSCLTSAASNSVPFRLSLT